MICGVSQAYVLGPLLFKLYTADTDGLIRSLGLNTDSYADHNQVYSSCLHRESTVLTDKILDCIDAFGKWMASNRLMLNPTKSKFMWCTTPMQVHLIDRSN